MGQKFTYTKLTVPLNSLEILENYVMALEVFDRLIDIQYFESIGGVPVDVFQGLPSNSVPICLTSWENQKKDLRKKL